MSPESRNPRVRQRGWFVVAVALMLGVFTAGWWIGSGAPPVTVESTAVSENAHAVADEPAASSVPLSPISDERDAPPVERAGVDASTFYKDAFALYASLSAEEKRMLNPKEKVDAEQAAALFEKIQPIMELLRRAAKADYCDWGLGEPSVGRPSPQMGKAVGLAGVAVWSAAYRFPTDQEGAIDDVSTLSPLGHHISDTLIGHIMSLGIEGWSADFFRKNAAGFNETARAKASTFLAGSTVDRDLKDALAGEIAIQRSLNTKQIAETPDERGKLIDLIGLDFGDESDPNSLKRRAQAEDILRDPTKFTGEMNFVQKAQAQMFEVMSGPDAQFDAWMEQFGDEHTAEHPLAVALIPVYGSIRQSLQSRKVRREMLSVGLAVFESGPEIVSRSRDSVTGRPFVYLRKADGFDLQSAFQSDGKPMTMSFDLPK